MYFHSYSLSLRLTNMLKLAATVTWLHVAREVHHSNRQSNTSSLTRGGAFTCFQTSIRHLAAVCKCAPSVGAEYVERLVQDGAAESGELRRDIFSNLLCPVFNRLKTSTTAPKVPEVPDEVGSPIHRSHPQWTCISCQTPAEESICAALQGFPDLLEAAGDKGFTEVDRENSSRNIRGSIRAISIPTFLPEPTSLNLPP